MSPPPPIRHHRRRDPVWQTVAAGSYVAVLLTAWIALQWSDRWWPATVLLFAPRWICVLPLAVLLPFSLFLRTPRIFFVLLVAAIIAFVPVSGFNIPWQTLRASAPAGIPLRVMTLNMHASHADPARLEELINQTAPDFLVIQEWSSWEKSRLHSQPDWHVHATKRQFLASRHPIRTATNLGEEPGAEHVSVVRYELETPAGIVSVLSLHTASNRRGIADLIHRDAQAPAEVEANSLQRWDQSAYVAASAQECHGPLIILGDFNTPPESAIIPEIWSDYGDSFASAGWGWGYTFYGANTCVRIDYIRPRRGWYTARCEVGPDVGSPHRPVIADLIWTEPKK